MEPRTKTNTGFSDSFSLHSWLLNQTVFSKNTFGPGRRTKGIVQHIRKELEEIEASPDDLSEWIDVIILGFDGALRLANFLHSPTSSLPGPVRRVIVALQTKLEANKVRDWPDWREKSEDEAIEHVWSGGNKNPWSSEGWNVTAQAEYVREHGADKASAMASAAHYRELHREAISSVPSGTIKVNAGDRRVLELEGERDKAVAQVHIQRRELELACDIIEQASDEQLAKVDLVKMLAFHRATEEAEKRSNFETYVDRLMTEREETLGYGKTMARVAERLKLDLLRYAWLTLNKLGPISDVWDDEGLAREDTHVAKSKSIVRTKELALLIEMDFDGFFRKAEAALELDAKEANQS